MIEIKCPYCEKKLKASWLYKEYTERAEFTVYRTVWGTACPECHVQLRLTSSYEKREVDDE